MRHTNPLRRWPRLAAFLSSEPAAGVVLMAAAAVAIALANSPWHDAYHAALHQPLTWTPIAKLTTLHAWINDALMAVFFFVVGLEIKREVLAGELATASQRRLPVVAAIAGMVLPAIVFLAIARDAPEIQRGWAIPAATDIAFALGVIGLVGRGLPRSLRLFLLTVAIVDDLGAVMIIAAFYTAQVSLPWLAIAAAITLALWFTGRQGLRQPWIFAVGAIVLWFCVLHSGIHATIAGVAAALTVPMRLDRHGDSPLLRMEHALVPWNGFVIVPLFGLANAGVAVSGLHTLGQPLPLAIALGLFLGKQIGIFAAIWLAERTGFARRPEEASWAHLWGIALLCGIGFTMSLFIGALAFPAHPDLVEEAKLGVLAGSLLSALTGLAVLRLARNRSGP